MSIRHNIFLSSSALAAALLVSACGGGGSSAPNLTAQTITWSSAPTTGTAGSAAVALSATAPGGTVVFTVPTASASVCSVSGANLTYLAAGTCTVNANQAGSSTYAAATEVQKTITVDSARTTFATFDETTAPTLAGFGSLVGEVATDPAGGTNKVAKLTKPSGAQTWAGATITTCGAGTLGSVPTIPMSSTNKTMTLRAYSPVANTKFRLKIEDASNGTRTVETDATVTAANTWQTLTFDFGSPAMGTAALNTAYTYNTVSVFPNFDVAGTSTNNVFYVDDLKFMGVTGVSQTCAVALASPTLPISFDSTTVAYTLTDFGGNVGSVDTAPTGGSGKAAKIIKGASGATSETWAGTTIVTGTIPFTSSAKTMSVEVWAPAVGKQIRLKAENLTDPTVSVETEATTTTAAGWQTLTFNFANQASGTAAIDVSKVYGKVSIFFDFGVGGTGQTYWFDNLRFGAP